MSKDSNSYFGGNNLERAVQKCSDVRRAKAPLRGASPEGDKQQMGVFQQPDKKKAAAARRKLSTALIQSCVKT
jgi:hypothetical protein